MAGLDRGLDVASTPPPPGPRVVPPTPERALLSGSAKESCEVLVLDQDPTRMGDLFGRFLAAWDGACMVATARGTDPAQSVGSFSAFRRSFVRDGAPRAMVMLLKSLAQSERATPGLAGALEEEEDEEGQAVPLLSCVARARV